MEIKTTKVFQRNYEALHAKNPDGSRKYKYIINKGSSRSSKTYSLIDLFDIYARTTPNQRMTIWRDTKTDCKKTVLSDMLKYHKSTNRYQQGYIFNKTESIFFYEHPHNSTTTVEIHGTDDEETVHGLTQNVAWLNEPYKISKDTFDQIDMRSDVLFIDYNPKKDHYIEDIAKQDNAIVIHSTYKDNPFCPEEQRIKIQSYQPIDYARLIIDKSEDKDKILAFETRLELEQYLSAKDYKDYLKAELIRTYNNEHLHTANEYKHQVYALGEKAENPNKIYNNWIRIRDEEFDKAKEFKQLQSYYGLDFGFAHASACVEVLFDGDRTLYVREKLYKALKETNKSLGQLMLDAKIPTGNVTYIVCDPQDNLNGVGNNMVNDLRVWHGFNAIKGVKPSYAERFHYINNMVVKYTASSKNFESEYEGYEYATINGMQLEKPLKVDDDLMNAFEYVAWFIKLRYKIHV